MFNQKYEDLHACVGSQKHEVDSRENRKFDEIMIKDQKDRDFRESAGNIKRCGIHTFKCQISCFSLFDWIINDNYFS